MAAILETSPFTHFWFPRRWIVPSGQYITSTPWVPDFQPRLLRNNIEGLSFSTKLHEPIRVLGAAGWFQNLTIRWRLSHGFVEVRCRRVRRFRPQQTRAAISKP
jgi:hypothetical protein